MKKRFIFAFALISLSALVACRQDSNPNIEFNANKPLPFWAKRVICSAYEDYQQRYSYFTGKLLVSDTVINKGVTETNELFSITPGSGSMLINLARLNSEKFSSGEFRGDLTEEFYLTTAPNEAAPVEHFALDVSLRNGVYDSVVGQRGLVLKVKSRAGNFYECEMLETTISHALGKPFASSDYSKDYPTYRRLTQFGCDIIDNSWVSVKTLFEAEKTSDVKSVVGAILNKPATEVTGKDINFFISLLFEVYKDHVKVPDAITAVQMKRNKK